MSNKEKCCMYCNEAILDQDCDDVYKCSVSNKYVHGGFSCTGFRPAMSSSNSGFITRLVNRVRSIVL